MSNPLWGHCPVPWLRPPLRYSGDDADSEPVWNIRHVCIMSLQEELISGRVFFFLILEGEEGGQGRERERENPRQAPYPACTRMQGSISQP